MKLFCTSFNITVAVCSSSLDGVSDHRVGLSARVATSASSASLLASDKLALSTPPSHRCDRSHLIMTSDKPKSRVFPVSTCISNLPDALVPKPRSTDSETSGSQPKRLVIVGDVHGTRDALEKLLQEVKFNKNDGDHLILVGDVINKGADNPGVIDLAVKLQASAVRGNHDNAVLDAASQTRLKNGEWTEAATLVPAGAEETQDEAKPLGVQDAQDPQAEEQSAPQRKPHKPVTVQTAASLSIAQLKWLAALPLILQIDLPSTATSTTTKLVVVHAGLVPGVPLEQQDPHAVMHLRSLSSAESGGFQAVEEDGEEGWAAAWERAQEALPESERTMVVFGHDARRKLQVRKYSVGLDTGCVYGNQLSALVVTATEKGIEHQVVQVDGPRPEEPKVAEQQQGQVA